VLDRLFKRLRAHANQRGLELLELERFVARSPLSESMRIFDGGDVDMGFLARHIAFKVIV
jgi:hypothetical protein